MRTHVLLALATTTLLLAPLAADAAPADARVGETRLTFAGSGTTLRAQPGSLGQPLATLPAGTRVVVREVRLPWLRVDAPSASGWIAAIDTIEPAALTANGPPPARTAGSGNVSGRDVSAAGRQFDADVERGYRRSKPNLEAAYRLVDTLEQETMALDPATAVSFIVEGRLGRRGQDWARPARLPPTPRAKTAEAKTEKRKKRIGGLLDDIADRIGVDDDVRDALKTGAGELVHLDQVSKSFTPDQEYYLGRAVAATAIAKYGIDPDPTRRGYVRLVGEAVVRCSTRIPNNYGGYHFEVLNSDTVNAMCGPGGFVLLTRGVVESCQCEEELAGVICHELAHATKKHGEAMLREGKSFQAFVQGIGRTGASAVGLDDNRILGQLIEVFDKAVGEMARTAMEANYSRGFELEADQEGTYLLADVLYDPNALQNLLARRIGTHGGSHSHDAPEVRAAQLNQALANVAQLRPHPDSLARRAERFSRWMRR